MEEIEKELTQEMINDSYDNKCTHLVKHPKNKDFTSKRDGTSINCNEKCKNHVSNLLNKHKRLVDDSPGLVRNYEHKLEVNEKEPFYVKIYPYSQ